MGPMLLDYTVNGHEPGEDPPPGMVVRGLRRRRAGWPSSPRTTRTGSGWRGWPARPIPATTPRSPTRSRTWAAALTPQQAMRMLQRAGLAAGAVQNNEDVTRDPQHRERHFLQEMDHPDLGVAEYAGPPYRLSKTPGHHPAADPAARGAHHRDPGRVAGHAARGKPDVRLAAGVPIRRAAVSRGAAAGAGFGPPVRTVLTGRRRGVPAANPGAIVLLVRLSCQKAHRLASVRTSPGRTPPGSRALAPKRPAGRATASGYRAGGTHVRKHLRRIETEVA